MQVVFDTSSIASIIASLLSGVLAVYLIRFWFRQESRLLTDLPLMFGIAFIAHALNQSMVLFQGSGYFEVTLQMFRIRALIVGGIALPLVGVVLHIWLPRISKFHIRIIGLVAAYWVSVVFLGPFQDTIMLLHLPVIVVLMGGMIVTFAVTWKIGRLKEVRSDLMVFSSVLSLVGQLTLVSFAALGLGIASSTIAVIATLCATLGLVNPWYTEPTPVSPI